MSVAGGLVLPTDAATRPDAPAATTAAPGDSSSEQDAVRRLRRVLEGLIGVPATEGNSVEVLRNGDEIFPAMLDAIAGARHTIDFLTFIYWTGDIGGRFAEALAERSRDGVRVRVLLDAIGARDMDHSLIDLMTGAGCDVRWFRPAKARSVGKVNHRTHRKVLICDEQVSFTGGVGIADVWQGDARNETEWRDTHFRLEGPVTDGLRAAFVDNWAETEGTVFDPDIDRFPEQPKPGGSTVQVVRGAAETGASDLATLFCVLLRLAQRRIRIATAYFNPDDQVVDLLCGAARRGVVVEVLIPGPHADKRFVQLASEAQYEALLEAGVRVCCFQPSMLHAKVMTVDSLVANVGSANVNSRSTQYDEEVNLVIFDRSIVRTLDEHFDDDLERSVELDLGRWQDRNRRQKVAERVVSVIRRLL